MFMEPGPSEGFGPDQGHKHIEAHADGGGDVEDVEDHQTRLNKTA
jgi:hypothetical protein